MSAAIRRSIRTITLILILLAAGLAQAQVHVTAPEGRITGEWWSEPGNPGWGLVLTHNNDQTVVQHVDFDDSGRNYWQVGVGPRAGTTFSADLVRTLWDHARQSLATQRTTGRVTLERIDADAANVVLTVDGTVRTVRMQRIVIATDPVLRDASGLWVNPARPGIGLTLLSQGPVLGVLALAYDAAGEPRWWLAHGPHGLFGQHDLPAERFRRSCNPGCTVQAEAGGSIRVRWENDHRIQVRLALEDGASAPITEAPFTDEGTYHLLTAAASGRRYPDEARPFTSRAMLSAYQAMTRAPLGCIADDTGRWLQGGRDGARVGGDPNGTPLPWTFADAVADIGPFVAAVRDPAWPNRPDRVPVDLHRLDTATGLSEVIATFEPAASHPLATLILPLPDGDTTLRFLVVSDNGWSRCFNVPTPTSLLSFVSLTAQGQVTLERTVRLDVSVDRVFREGDRLFVLGNTPLVVAGMTGAAMPTDPRIEWSPGTSAALFDLPVHLGAAGEFDRTVMTRVDLVDRQPDRMDVRSLVLDGGTWFVGADAVSIVAEATAGNGFDPIIAVQSWALSLPSVRPRGGSFPGLFDVARPDAARLHQDEHGLVVVTNTHSDANAAAEIWRVQAPILFEPLAVTRLASIGPKSQDGQVLVPKRISHDGPRTQVTLGPRSTPTESALWIADRNTGTVAPASIDQFIGRRIAIDGALSLGLQRSREPNRFDARLRETRSDGSSVVGWTTPVNAYQLPALTIEAALQVDRAPGETRIAAPVLESYWVHGTTYWSLSLWVARVSPGVPAPLTASQNVPTPLASGQDFDPALPDLSALASTAHLRLAERTRVRFAGDWMFVFAGADVHALRLAP